MKCKPVLCDKVHFKFILSLFKLASTIKSEQSMWRTDRMNGTFSDAFVHGHYMFDLLMVPRLRWRHRLIVVWLARPSLVNAGGARGMPPAFTRDGLASQTIVAVPVQSLTYEAKYVLWGSRWRTPHWIARLRTLDIAPIAVCRLWRAKTEAPLVRSRPPPIQSWDQERWAHPVKWAGLARLSSESNGSLAIQHHLVLVSARGRSSAAQRSAGLEGVAATHAEVALWWVSVGVSL